MYSVWNIKSTMNLKFPILLFLPVFLQAQEFSNTLGTGKTGFTTVLGSGKGFGGSEETWAEKMLDSYMEINDHITFTQAQQDSILERLSEDYITTTFADKDTCDFFLYFQNSNTSTNLTTRTNTKTGATLRWNYGAGNVYNQNNLPAQINNGVITVTSEDGFGSWTVFNISTNTFSGTLPSLEYLTLMTTCNIYTNSALNGNLSKMVSPVLQTLNATTTLITGNISVFDELTTLKYISLPQVSTITGDISAFRKSTGITDINMRSTSVYGWLDSICYITGCNLQLQLTLINGYDGIKTIPVGWKDKTLLLYDDRFSTPSVDKLLIACDDAWADGSGELRIYNNGQYRSSLSDAAVASLQTKNIIKNATAITWLEKKHTLGYVDDDTKQLVKLSTFSEIDNATVHPDIIKIDGGLNGYEFWVGITPFTNKSPLYELPCIYATNDGEMDTLYQPTTNPLDEGSFSDSDIRFYNDTIYYIYRQPNENIWMIKSVDGVNWTDPYLWFTGISESLSPAMVIVNDTVKLYYINSNPDPNIIVTQIYPLGFYDDFYYDTVTAITPNAGLDWWHLDVEYYNGKYYLLLQAGVLGESGSIDQLILAAGTNGIDFTRDDYGVINRNQSFGGISHGNYTFYRSSFNEYNDSKYIMYFTVSDNDNPNYWQLGNVEMYLIE